MSNVTKLVKAGTWLTLANVLSKLAGWLTLPLLARLLGPAGLGIYSLVFVIGQAGQTLTTLGADVVMHRNGAQYKTGGEEAMGRLFGVGMSIICAASLISGFSIWIFRAPLAAKWLGSPELSAWLGAAALLIVVQPLGTVPMIFLASLQEFRAYAGRSLIGVVVGSALTVSLAWRYGIKGAVMGLIVAAVAQIGWSAIIVAPALRARKIRLRFDQFWQQARSILRLGFPYYYGNTLIGTAISVPIMGLVGKYGGLGDLAFLRVAQSMAAVIGFIPAAIAPAALSYLSASLTDDPGGFQRLRIVHLRSVWTILLVLTCAVCLLLPNIVQILFGRAYAPVYWLAWISLWLSVVMGLVAVLVQYLLVSGRTIRIAWVCTVGNICFLATSVFLVPRYGGLGFVFAQLAGQAVSLPLVFWPTIAELNREERRLVRNLVIATVAALLWTLWLSSINLSSPILLSVEVGTLAVLTTFLYLKVLSAPERILLKRLLTFRASYA